MLVLGLAVMSCVPRGTAADVERIDSFCRVTGVVARAGASGAPILVVALAGGRGGSVVNYDALLEPGSWALWVPSGPVEIWAFEDVDGDFVRDADEPAGTSGRVSLEPGERRAVDAIRLLAGRASPTLDVSSRVRHPKLAGFRRDLGAVVELDDWRFARPRADSDMWMPLKGLEEGAFGIYFEEEHDPCRTPVLFVHGIRGTPLDFEPLARSLDRSRFQVWYLLYPSGFRLGAIAEYLHDSVRILRLRHGLERLHVVAHSMGGVLARAFVLLEAGDRAPLTRAFVSVATPWGGIESARLGVRHAPVVLPVWRDIHPGSAFLRGLYATSLPGYVEHHLLFAFGDDGSDGVVSVASQLHVPAQREATRVRGYFGEHVGVLGATSVSAYVGEALQSAEGPRHGSCGGA